MKTYLIVLVCLILVFAGCEKETENHLGEELNFELAVPGGCNTLTQDDLKSGVQERDTVYFTIIGDTLDLFTGLNYLCCAPFVSETEVKGDSILVLIKDNCNFPQQNCYCKCNCYYTWNFKFTGFFPGKYNYKIELFDPRVGENSVFSEGFVEI